MSRRAPTWCFAWLAAFAAFARLPLGLAAANPVQGDVTPGLYKVRDLPDVRVRMRDGVELAVRIIRPDAEGKFPAVMAYYPYRLLTQLKPASSEREYSNLFNAPYYLAERGYISVNYDVRGTGASGGSSPDMYSDAERQDGYDMVEWIARQPWSNGNVGMWGLSYGGVDTWQVAALAPPHLKAIIVGDGTEDEYGDWTYPGGVPRPIVFGGFAAGMAASNFAPPDRSRLAINGPTSGKSTCRTMFPGALSFSSTKRMARTGGRARCGPITDASSAQCS